MSFSNHARRVCDPALSLWQRWSSLHSCLECIRHLCPPGTFPATHEQWVRDWNISPNNPPAEAQLHEALRELSVARNLKNDRLNAFAHKRIRQKMRGRQCMSRAERQEWERIHRVEFG